MKNHVTRKRKRNSQKKLKGKKTDKNNNDFIEKKKTTFSHLITQIPGFFKLLILNKCSCFGITGNIGLSKSFDLFLSSDEIKKHLVLTIF